MNARQDAETIFRAAVTRVDPAPMIEGCLSLGQAGSQEVLLVDTGLERLALPLPPGGRIFATGMGKASARMALGLERSLGGRLAGGLVAVKHGHVERLERLRLVEAGHPTPDESSARAARMVLGLNRELGVMFTERDLVIVLVSGGGSAILCAPAAGITLEDKIGATSLLLGSGAGIHEMNCVRKHLSAIKGGGLAAALAPARVLSLILSDVVGDDLDVIASGPTVPDPTSFAEALAIVERRGLSGQMPGAVIERLTRGARGELPETPKPGDPLFASTNNILVGSNRLALAAAESEARRLGYGCLVLTSRLCGEAREAAKLFLGMGQDITASGLPIKRPACVLAGGETTVTLRGKGRGGRNQEMALAFLAALAKSPGLGRDLSFLSAGTDGNDGPTDAAGAFADLGLVEAAGASRLDPERYLEDNDSYSFFDVLGGLVKTGPTNTNVCDIQVLLVP